MGCERFYERFIFFCRNKYSERVRLSILRSLRILAKRAQYTVILVVACAPIFIAFSDREKIEPVCKPRPL